MHILHIYKDYWPVVGGIENHIKLLAERQAECDHHVTVLVTQPAGQDACERLDGVRIIRARRLATIASTPLSLTLPRWVGRIHADIAHLHFPDPPGELAQHLWGKSKGLVITYHSDVVRQQTILRFYRPLMLRILRRADRILVSSPNYLNSSEVLQELRARCTVIPFGIDQERFRERDPQALDALRQRIGPGPYVLFVGVLRYYKGVAYLLEAMRHVEARLIVVGSGPLADQLRAQASQLGIAERVTFAGRVSNAELPSYYQLADLFVLPACARSEAFGIVQLEALAAGLPIVSTELGTGTSWVNREGVSGLVVAPRDSRALAEAINRILSDDELRRRLAEGARERAESFTAQRMIDDVERIYREVLAEANSQ